MGAGRALLGLVGLVTIAGAHAWVGAVVQRRWYPALPAPTRQLIVAVVALTSATTVGALLGTLGWFRPLALVGGSVAVAVAAALGRSRDDHDVEAGADEPAPHGVRTPMWSKAAAAVAAGVLAVRWLAETVQTAERGFSHADELHYHLTHAAFFAQSGRTWPIRFTSVGDGAAYHPAHSELLHGIGLSVLGSDFASIAVNLGFAAMALAAGWAIGARARCAPAGLLLVGALLSLPLVTSEAGSTLNDTMAIALTATSVALLLTGPAGRGAAPHHVAMAGVAAGLAVGTKLTVVVAVGALVLVVLARPASRRLRDVATFVGAASLAGGYWYLRNLVATGNPVPALSFGPLPGPDLELQRAVEFPIVDYLVDAAIWREWFVPGLERFFGPLWVLVPAIAAVGVVLAASQGVRRWDVRWTLLAVMGVLSLVGYAMTPTSAAGRPDEPVLFTFNLRYALPGLLLCCLAGLAHPVLRRHPGRAAAVGVAAFAASNLHGIDPRRGAIAAAATALLAVAVLVAVRAPRRALLPAGALGLVLAVGAGFVLQDRYLERRWTAELPRWRTYAAGDQASGVRVGVTGFPQSYPFFGAGLDNTVVTLGDASPGDELAPLTTCSAWWDAVRRNDLDVVVVLSERALAASDLGRHLIHEPVQWLRAGGAAPVVAARDAAVYDVRSASPACDG